MWDMLKGFVPRAVQDLITSAAALLVAHGYITSSQEQGFIGSAFFLVMLAVNYFIAQSRKTAAVKDGAMYAGQVISNAEASAIVKGKTP